MSRCYGCTVDCVGIVQDVIGYDLGEEGCVGGYCRWDGCESHVGRCKDLMNEI